MNTWYNDVMKLTPQARKSILRRLEEIEPEICRAEANVRELRNHDPATKEVVTRGAVLCSERPGLRRRLEHDDAERSAQPPATVGGRTMAGGSAD